MPETAQSKIFMLSASDFAPGICGICGQAVLIKWRDVSTGAGYGQCCLEAALFSERALASCARIRPPTLEESRKQK